MGSYYYAITTLNLEGERRKSTVGCFPTLAEAEQCVLENWGNIYENGWYPWVVIEELIWGLYPCSQHTRWFFRWHLDDEGGGYVANAPPAEDENITVYFG